MPNNGNDGLVFVGTLGVGAAVVVGRGFIIILSLGLCLSLQLRAGNSVSDVFTNAIGEKMVILFSMSVDNGLVEILTSHIM